MEFGDDGDHEDEEELEEADQEDDEEDDDDDDEGITIPPPPLPPQPSTEPSQTTNHNQNQPTSIKPGFITTTMTTTPTTTATATTATSTTTPRYRECLKNHAVSMGGHAVDGCGEFMPAGEDGTLDALKCAACGCHRNFHRKESDTTSHSTTPTTTPPPLYTQFTSSPYYRTPLPPQPSPFQVIPPPQPQPQPPPNTAVSGHHHYRPLALPSTVRGDHYPHPHPHHPYHREVDEYSNPSSSGGGGGGGGGRRVGASGSEKSKRFRTKFTPEQKERMFEFAERVGWRLQKHDELAVQQFCQEVGVRRQVLKVWMHNNKNTLGSGRRSSTA